MTILELRTPTIERPHETLPEAPTIRRPDASVPGPPRHRGRLVLAIGAVVAALAALTVVLVMRDGSTSTELRPVPELNPATEQVPSGSPFDAQLSIRMNPATEQVPSGSPFDAQLSAWVNPATEQVPSGSPFDAPSSIWLDPETERVPSGSPFDAN